jgi:diguanylate cyclase (GGDEF)-like protein/PAS domain S-box-containing protein
MAPDSNDPGFLSSAQVLEQLVDSVRDYAIYALDIDGRVATWNHGAETITGYDAMAVVGRHFACFYTAEAMAAGHPERQLERATALGRYEEEGWRVRRDGRRFWARATITALFDDEGRMVGFGEVVADLTERKQVEEERANVMALLQTTVRTDPLTGLPNRRAWEEAIERELSAAFRSRTRLTVAIVDLDRFKRYNDGHGHQAGDRLLKHAAGAWRAAIRGSDTLARYGGEEFALVLPDCGAGDALLIVERLRAATPYGQTCSAGVAEWDGEQSVEQLIARADMALYAAKGAGRNRAVAAT